MSEPRRRAPRGPTAADRALWRAAMRDTKPLPGRALPPVPAAAPPDPPSESPAPAAAASVAPATPKPPLPGLTATATPGLDRRMAERLKRGRLPIEARLDLHGMTRQAAHGALASFVAEAAGRGLRLVLVITGKGRRLRPDAETAEPWTAPEGGVLRREVPRWLNEPALRPLLLGFSEAQPVHGGAGALYLLVRRRR